MELELNASITKKIWLTNPRSLELYVYIDPNTITPYIRNSSAPTTVLTLSAAQAELDRLNGVINDKIGSASLILLGPEAARARVFSTFPSIAEEYARANSNVAIAKSPPWSHHRKCKPIFITSAGGDTYTLDTTADMQNKAFCSTQVTPELLSLLPVPAHTFLTKYIQRRMQTVTQRIIQSDVEYQAARDAYNRYNTDLSGRSIEILGAGIIDKVGRYRSANTNNRKIYLTRMILEGLMNPIAVPITDPAYVSAAAAYDKFIFDLSSNPTLSSISIEGRIVKYLPQGNAKSKSLLSAMFIVTSKSVNVVASTSTDFTSAQAEYSQYRRDIAGNTALLAKSVTEKVSIYVGGQSIIVKSYFMAMLQNKSTEMSSIDKNSIDYKNAKTAFDNYLAVPADSTLTNEEKVSKYVRNVSDLTKAYFTIFIGATAAEIKSFDALPPPIKAKEYFNNYAPDSRKRFDQIAQAFYNFNDGTKAMTYIYDVFPIGKSILDVRFDLTTNIPPVDAVSKMQALTTAYKAALITNLSVNQQATLISNYQEAYAAIRDTISDLSGKPVESGATRRFFYTLSGPSGENIIINGMANDGIAAGSFHIQYACGIDTPTGDSAGKVMYSPNTKYTKNSSDSLDCNDRATLMQICIDYVSALSTDMAYVLKTVSNPWDQDSNLYVTKILARQQLTPMSCNLQWEETSFDYTTNKPGRSQIRTVYIPYLQNSSDWFATEILFDASGFKYLSTVPAGLTPFPSPIIIPPPYIDNQQLDSGGICPKVDCSDPATLYKMVDDYNTTEDNPGVILSVVKAVTMNSGQCDLLVDMDYTGRKDLDNDKKTGTVREAVSITLALNVPTCKYDYIDYDIAYGITDQTPLMKDPSGNITSFNYMLKFGLNVFTDISKAANSVVSQAKSVYDSAVTTLTTYRETTYARAANIKSFNGCPDVRCHNLNTLSDIFHGYDRANKFKSRMGKIIQVATSLTTPNACDVMFEAQPITGWNDASGLLIYGPTQTTAAKFTFITDSASGYDQMFNNQIDDLTARLRTASTAEAATIKSQILDISNIKADVKSTISCGFTMETITNIPIIAPTKWETIKDLNKGLPVLNPSKNDISSAWNNMEANVNMFPFPNPYPPLAVNCKDYRVINAIRSKSIETRGKPGESAVIGYTIDKSVPNKLTLTDIKKTGVVQMSPITLVSSNNLDYQTCAVEMVMSDGAGGRFSVNRQYKFDLTDTMQYQPISMMGARIMPKDTTATSVYKEFRDISPSGVYSGIKLDSLRSPSGTYSGTNMSNLSSSNELMEHIYNYTGMPIELNQDITNEIPLVVDPTCAASLNFTDVSNVSIALEYNGYPKAYKIAALSDSRFEIRITKNEYLPFGSTYKIVSFYTGKNNCEPIVNSFTDSNPILSKLSSPVDSINSVYNLRALRDYFTRNHGTYVNDMKPKRILGQIWSGGVDMNTRLYIYNATMGEYDAEGNVLNFYGYPQNNYDRNILPRANLACEFRRRFDPPYAPYVANMYILKSMPTSVTSIIEVSDPNPSILANPYTSMTSYKYLEFIPLAVRKTPGRPNQMCQITRLEFYVGNALQTLTGSVDGSVLAPNYMALQTIKGFSDLFKTDGQTMDPLTQSSFVCISGTSIFASSPRPLKIDGISFITGRDPAFDILQWKLRGSMNNIFWKDIYTSSYPIESATYPSYGYWRTPIMTFNNLSIALPQNSSRPKGFIECGSSVNTLRIVETLSAFTYNTYSQAVFQTNFLESEKNLNRIYLRDLSDMVVDDFNNTIYIRANIQRMDSTYTLTPSSVIFALSFTRSMNCVQNYTITVVTLTDLLTRFQASSYSNPRPTPLTTPPAFTPVTITLGPNDTFPYAYRGYPTVLDKQYRTASLSFDPSSIPPYTVSSFRTNGPNRTDPATNTITVNPSITRYTNMSAEGAAQMCADNIDCIGFSVDGMTGSFVGKPNNTNRIVFTASTGSFYFKNAYSFTRCIRFKSMKARSGTTIAIHKVAFYNGSQMVTDFKYDGGSCYAIDSAGNPSSVPIVNGLNVGNLLNYTSSAGWQSSGVDGFILTFETPMNFDGYTFVTPASTTESDPVSWTIETGMSAGGPWTLFEDRTYRTATARNIAYPIFRPNKDSLISNDFTAKTLTTCGEAYSCRNLLPQITQLYKTQKNENFYVDAFGYDITTNQCIIGWDDTSGDRHTTGFTFTPVYGDCDNIKAPSNIKIKELTGIAGLTRIPYTPGSGFTFVRFKPTALNGGVGTRLSFFGLMNNGSIITPISVTNVANSDTFPAGNLANTNLAQEWQARNMGNLIFTYAQNTAADAFTMITGNGLINAPVSWVLEASTDRVIWSMLHEQLSAVRPPVPKQQYPVYGFDGSVTQLTRGVLDKTLKDQGLQCDSREIINKVNTQAFNSGILFNPIGYIYDESTNQCKYKQADGNSVNASFLTSFSNAAGALNGLDTRCTGVVKAAAITGGTPMASGLKGIDDPDCGASSCDNSGLLTAIDTFYKRTGINTTGKSFSATKTAFDPTRNECIFELDSMFAPIDLNGQPAIPGNRIGFQIQKNTGCTVPGTNALIINTSVPATQSLTAPQAQSGPYKFVRFKPTTGGMNISAFQFFNKTSTSPNYVSLPYTAVITNPLGQNSGNTTPTKVENSFLGRFNDYLNKPLQFTFTPALNFTGYSWTTDSTNSSPTAWILQISTNGYIWTDVASGSSSVQPGGSPMPIYWLDGSTPTPRTAAAVVKTSFTLSDRGIQCSSLQASVFSAVADITGGDANSIIARSNPTYNNATNTCVFNLIDSSSGTPYTATVNYELGSSATSSAVVKKIDVT